MICHDLPRSPRTRPRSERTNLHRASGFFQRPAGSQPDGADEFRSWENDDWTVIFIVRSVLRVCQNME